MFVVQLFKILLLSVMFSFLLFSSHPLQGNQENRTVILNNKIIDYVNFIMRMDDFGECSVDKVSVFLFVITRIAHTDPYLPYFSSIYQSGLHPRAHILVQATIYCRLRIGQSEANHISYIVREYRPMCPG